MQDKNSQKRFFIALLLSIFIHLLIIAIIYGLSKLTLNNKPHLEKINASNLLILKRGHSQDSSKTTPGAPPPSLASNNHSQSFVAQPPMPPSQPMSKPTPQKQEQSNQKNQKENPSKKTEQKKQHDSSNKALQKYQKDYIDPKNLSFLSKEQALAFQSPASQNLNATTDNNNGTNTQTQQDIDELYGEEFGDLGSAEKNFIKNNLREIGRITQKYLQYPRTAAYLGQDGQNIVEFYLHPNGDISDLKILDKSDSLILDKNTLKTIEVAYKDYPRPTVTTLIRIRVRYFMFR